MHEPEHTQATRVVHEIEPVFDGRSRVLLLGTMPSPKSREAGFFYGHPQNRFWRVLAALFDEPVPRTTDEKRDLLLRRGIALWDVLASCEIEGASDASIRDAKPNDVARIFEQADIRGVFCTGTKAGELYRKLIEPTLGMPCTALPSTSPANAKMRLADLIEAYGKTLLPLLDTPEKHVLDVADVAELETAIADGGTSLSVLMQRAGRALAHAALRRWNAEHRPAAANRADAHDAEADAARQPNALPRIVVLCGSGNNGGDGWVAARELAQAGCEVDLVSKRPACDISAEPAHEQALLTEAFANGNAKASSPHKQTSEGRVSLHIAPNAHEVETLLARADVIIDAILGTGFSGNSVRPPYDGWIRLANAQRDRGARIVAADIPSGLSAQTGKAAEPCIKAHETVTMITSKPGLETPYAFAFCGDVRVAEIAYVEPILDAWHQKTNEQVSSAEAAETPHIETCDADSATNSEAASPCATKRPPKHDPFRRAENEDDDGYDPYSDRPPAPEPLFEADPWD